MTEKPATDEGWDPPPPKERPGNRTRTSIVALVVVSALIPSLLVGLASYLSARDILLEKVHGQLAERVATAAQLATSWIADRNEDTRVFATSFLVEENLDTLGRSPADRDRAAAVEQIESYLRQVGTRDDRYAGLSVYGPDGTLIAHTGAHDAPSFESLPELNGDRAEPVLLDLHGTPLVSTSHAIGTNPDDRLGSLVTGASLESLWRRLRALPHFGGERLRVVDADRRILFDSQDPILRNGSSVHSEAVDRCLASATGTSEYRDDNGNGVLGGYQPVAADTIGILVEVPAQTAFSAVRRLHMRSFVISGVAACLMAGLALLLALSMSRPLRALIEGARAVSDGDLTHRIAVTSQDEFGYLTGVFNRMAASLQKNHNQLELLSTTDALTGLSNRRQLTPIFERELSRAKRTGESFSILMIDIDHFKAFNDQHGHLEGDRYLREAAELLTEELRPIDETVRYGGEEFLVLLPSTPRNEAVTVAERLRETFAETFAAQRTDSSPMTISIGIATAPADGATDLELTRAADDALYRAKNAGRNRVVDSASSSGAKEPIRTDLNERGGRQSRP